MFSRHCLKSFYSKPFNFSKRKINLPSHISKETIDYFQNNITTALWSYKQTPIFVLGDLRDCENSINRIQKFITEIEPSVVLLECRDLEPSVPGGVWKPYKHRGDKIKSSYANFASKLYPTEAKFGKLLFYIQKFLTQK